MQEVLKVIAKNSFEEFIVSKTEHKGHLSLDIRVFYKDRVTEEMRPSKKGVAIPFDKVGELKAALEGVNALSPVGETLVEISKGDREVIRLVLKEFKGHKLIDLRQYFEYDGTFVPTQRGVSMQFHKLPELKEAVGLWKV